MHGVYENQFDCSRYIKNPKPSNFDQIEPVSLLTQTVLSQKIPSNDTFVQMYKELSSSETDMKFDLRNQSYKCHQIVFKQNSYM